MDVLHKYGTIVMERYRVPNQATVSGYTMVTKSYF